MTLEKIALLWETEGGKPLIGRAGAFPRLHTLTIVDQNVKRRELVEKPSKALKALGFHPTIRLSDPPTLRCQLRRVKEIECFLKRVRPYLITQERRKAVDKVLTQLAKMKPVQPPRPFHCPKKSPIF